MIAASPGRDERPGEPSNDLVDQSAARAGGRSRIEIADLDMVPATQAKNRFGDLLHRVCYDRRPVLIERGGRPMAVILDVEQYLELKRQARANQPPAK